MFSSSIIDFWAAKFIDKHRGQRLAKYALAVSIGANLSLLGYFKYFVFLQESYNQFISFFNLSLGGFQISNIILPVGISFYTFQSMSYSVDVYRGTAPLVNNFRTFSCYVSLFPQLVAGPIVRYNVVAEALIKRTHTLDKVILGTQLFCLGFAKKILLANPIGQVADKVWESSAPGVLASWWGNLAYMMQIYFDFSAYSEMAYGLGLILGFKFVQNFNAPYHAKSITDFWGRWHMSLTNWFRDYLYIPLGGNRVSTKKRLYFNLFIVMFLSGVWHGAQWTFILWGLFHALWLILERRKNKEPLFGFLPKSGQWLVTQFLVLMGWVLFRAPDLSGAIQMFKNLFAFGSTTVATSLLHSQIFSSYTILFMILGFAFIFQPLQSFAWAQKNGLKQSLIIGVLFLISCIQLFAQSFNPFLYFQF